MLDARLEVPGAGGDRTPEVTKRHHLKELVRARMARTGESYTSARAQLARRARGRVTHSPVVIVPVRDVDRAIRFYNETLGLPIVSAAPTWTVVGDDDNRIALEPAATTAIDTGLGFRVDDLDLTLRAITAVGGTVLSRAGPAARVADLDGNVFRLLSKRST